MQEQPNCNPAAVQGKAIYCLNQNCVVRGKERETFKKNLQFVVQLEQIQFPIYNYLVQTVELIQCCNQEIINSNMS